MFILLQGGGDDGDDDEDGDGIHVQYDDSDFGDSWWCLICSIVKVFYLHFVLTDILFVFGKFNLCLN